MSKPIFSRPSIKVFKSASPQKNYLIIPDIHFPYHLNDAIKFCKSVQELFKVPEDNVIQLGDMEDNFFLGAYPKGADMLHTPDQELEEARKHIREMAKAFPMLSICTSNHASRYYRKAAGGELPTQVLRNYKELFEYPKGWDVQECFVTNTKMPFLSFHGEGYSDRTGRTQALHFGMSTAFGHLHGGAGVNWVNTHSQDIWGMNCGCLIDNEQYCFQYAKHSKIKPSLGVGIVIDSGRCPIWIPYTGQI
jgi:hypothetical protein